MHRSFEAWRQELEDDNLRFETPDTLEKDLKEIEATLPLNLKEAEQLQLQVRKSPARAYESQPFQASPYRQNASLAHAPAPLSPKQEKLSRFTEQLAQEVIGKLERLDQLEQRDEQREAQFRQYKPQMEKLDEIIRDNRTLARQVKMLLEERDRMVQALSFYETEYPRFQKVVGNMYVRS